MGILARLTIALFLSVNAHALKDDFFLQGAAGSGGTNLVSEGVKDNAALINFNTHAGFHLGDIDLIFNSQISIAEYSRAGIRENNISYDGNTEYHSFALGPLLRYISNLQVMHWNFFLQGGYLWSISTIKPDDPDFPDNAKVTYHGKGPTIGIGFVQDKEAYPLFFSIDFKELKSWSARYVDITKDGRLSVEKRSERLNHPLEERTISINFGVEFL